MAATPKPHASVQQNDPEVLERFRAAVGVGKVYGPYVRKEGPSHDGYRRIYNPYWSWALGGVYQVRAFFDLMEPYLGTLKREQGNRVLDAYEEMVS